MNTNEFYNKSGLEARKLRKDEIDEFAINLRLKWKDQEFTRIADRIWASNAMKAMLNFTPQMGKLEDEERVLPVKEINKWCKRSVNLFSIEQVQEEFFSIYQRDPANAIQQWSPYKSYLPGELVQYVPEVDGDIWRLDDKLEQRGNQIFDKESNTLVRPEDAKWKVWEEVKGEAEPVEIQPPTQVAFDAFQPEILDLSTMARCYWMCLKYIDGEERVKIERGLNETDANFRIRVALQEQNDRKEWIRQKLEPRLDYLRMDSKWIPMSRKRGIQDKLKGRGWPGSKYWVCLHFRGTGQLVTEPNRSNNPMQELRISHQQVWFARSTFLARLVKVHGNIPNLLAKYNRHQTSGIEEEKLRKKVLNAFTEIDRYTNDLNDLGTVTINRAMDVIASDMVNNSHREKYQLFYRKDFQCVIETSDDGINRTNDEDVWGKIVYITEGARTKYGHGVVKAMEEVFTNQGLRKHETYIRRVRPREDQDDKLDPVETVERHWDERALLWRELYNYFHKPLIEWEKMHFEFHHSTDEAMNKRLGISHGRFHELIKEIYSNNGGLPFAQVPAETNYYVEKIFGTEKSMGIVREARKFFDKGLTFFKLAFEEEQAFIRLNPIGDDTSEEAKKMVYSMLRYRPAGKEGNTIRYILRCLYNGASNTDSGALHKIASDGSQFFDWGTRVRKLFFKFCMFYGLLRQRSYIAANVEFEEIYNNWSTIRLRSFNRQDIKIDAFQTIWAQGAKAVAAAAKNQIWQIDIFQKDGPVDGSWQAFDAHPLKEYNNKGEVIEIRPNKYENMPLLFKTKKSDYWKKKYGPERGELIRWKKMLTWWFIYLRKLDMSTVDSDWSQGTSVYEACNQLREKHIRFLIAYLPEYRIHSDKLYGPLVFARLQKPSETVYDNAVLHVVGYCDRLEFNKDTLVPINEDLTCMQWTVNGFNEDDNINVWLSGTKNILTQTITKNPINQYGPTALTPEQEATLRDVYDETGNQVRQEVEENIREYNKLRIAQAKDEEALIEIHKDAKKAEDNMEKLKKEEQQLVEKLRQVKGLIGDLKQKAVANPDSDE